MLIASQVVGLSPFTVRLFAFRLFALSPLRLIASSPYRLFALSEASYNLIGSNVFTFSLLYGRYTLT